MKMDATIQNSVKKNLKKNQEQFTVLHWDVPVAP